MVSRQNKIGLGIAFICIAVLAIIYYDSLLERGPLNTHLWRQTDCLSITKNYADGAPFFEPEMHVLYADNETSGKSAGEFPILYYAVGSIWKVTGESFMVYRVFYLLILVTALLAFFKSLQMVFGSNFWSIALTLILFTSPVLAYYGISFLTDAPAFCFMLISLYCFTVYQIKGKRRWLYWFAAFMALAGLLKISMLISFVFLGFIYLLELFPTIKTLGSRKLFEDRKHGFIALLIVVLVILSWYGYAGYYNSIHKFEYTFNSTYSLWDVPAVEMKNLFQEIQFLTIPVFYSKPMLLLLGGAFIFNLFSFKKVPLFAYLASIVIPFGAFSYFVLWAPLMGVHDYYYVAYLVLVPGILLPLVWRLKTIHSKLYSHLVLKAAFVVFLVFNIIYCKEVIAYKTLRQNGDSLFIANEDFKKVMRWTNWTVSEHWNSLYLMRSSLAEMGIKKEDKVIAYPDFSFNTSLYLMDRNGWTNMRDYRNQESIDYLKSKGAKYIVIHDPSLLTEPFIAPYLDQQIGQYKNVSVFKI